MLWLAPLIAGIFTIAAISGCQQSAPPAANDIAQVTAQLSDDASADSADVPAAEVDSADAALANGATCTVDAACASGWCNSGKCTATYTNGTTCSANKQCGSGNCIDSVCCDAPCPGQCESCNAPGMRGKCSPVTGGPTLGRGMCTGVGTTCAGQCDGVHRSGCTYPATERVCRTFSCAGWSAVSGATCDGAGHCPSVVTQNCMPYQCGPTGCATSCAKDTDCFTSSYGIGYFCSGGACVHTLSNGSTCAAGTQCASNFCVDGVCCESGCAGQCETCNAAGTVGHCVARKGAPAGSRTACNTDGSSCGGSCNGVTRTACTYPSTATSCGAGSCVSGIASKAAMCNGSGSCNATSSSACAPYACGTSACLTHCSSNADCAAGNVCGPTGACTPQIGNGAACGNDGQCGSGHCVEGVCCDSTCSGQCESCNAPGGTAGVCTAVTGSPVGGRSSCAGSGSSCAGRCDGVQRATCVYPGTSKSCRASTCNGWSATPGGSCDGAGGCSPPPVLKSCLPYACRDSACLTTCAVDGDCFTDDFCQAGRCLPKLSLGGACTASTQCSNGQCTDGVCCNGACTGQCEACNVPGSLGSCSPVTGAPTGTRAACATDGTACGGSCNGVSRAACTYPASTVSCGAASCSAGVATATAMCTGAGACSAAKTTTCSPFVCGATACLSRCASDGDCVAGDVCNASGSCIARLAIGSACTAGNLCSSGSCVDGVCCDSACDGQCEACNVPGSLGTCAGVKGAPVGARAACTSDGGACGGTCDGSTRATCAYPSAASSCRTASCTAGVATMAASCDGKGRCPAASTTSCAPFACGATACASTCASDADCAAGNSCTAGACSAKLAAGSACTGQNQCASGFCVGGVCCDSACGAPYQACSVAGSVGTCTRSGVPSGGACTSATECGSGSCVDGVCCDSACVGQCEACNVAGSVGICAAVTGAPVGARTGCPSDGSACGGSCDGSNRTACAFPSASASCRVAACSGGVLTSAATCDGKGACPASATMACDDGNPCNGVEVCGASGCVPGTSPTLDDGNPCTVDACTSATGVTHTPASTGTACFDGNLCNGTETCDATGHCLPGKPVSPSDGDPCTLDTCDPSTGVHHSVPDASCSTTAATWQMLAGRPSPRDSAASAFDDVHEQLIYFGGENGGVSLDDTWTWALGSGWSGTYRGGPTSRSGAAMAYDGARHRVVLFGGAMRAGGIDTYLNDTWEYDPASGAWQRRVPTAPPAARTYASLAFDPLRNRLVLFGGSTAGADFADTWEWDGAAGTWTQRSTATAPSARGGAGFVFDRAHAQFVLVGGAPLSSPSAPPFADTWSFDGDTGAWTLSSGSPAPAARVAHSMTYDPARSRALLFGGTGATSSSFGDVWELDGATTFTALSPSLLPPARTGGAMVFDPTSGHHLLVGGVAYAPSGAHTPALDDLWEYAGAESRWAERTANLAPALTRAGLVFDAARHVFVLRGDEPHAIVWELDNRAGRWMAKDALRALPKYGNGANPVGRLLFDTGRNVTLAVTAADAGTSLPGAMGLWEWDGGSWRERTCSGGPTGLAGSAIAFDRVRQRVIVFGGVRVSAAGAALFSNETWELDPTSCSFALRTTAAAPSARADAHMTWDVDRHVAVMFGGAAGTTVLSDAWEWDGAAGTWTARTTPAELVGRTEAAFTYDETRKRSVLFGGMSSAGALLQDVWEYDGATGSWATIAASGGPSARRSASSAFDPDRHRVVVFGGMTSSWGLADLWEWDGTAWARRKLGVVPSARSGASGGSVPHQHLAAMFGGVRGDGERAFLQDTWVWKDGEWMSVAPIPSAASYAYRVANTPAARAGHAFALGFKPAGKSSGSGLLFGGEGDSGLLGDTWVWDDATYAWSEYLPITVLGRASPSARTEHAMATVTEAGYLLFGGTDGSAALLGDTWMWTPDDGWAQRAASGPSPRASHALVTDPVRKKIVLFGGRGATGPLNDTWEWDMTASSAATGWTRRTPSISPPPMFGHRLAYDASRAKIVLTGGSGDDPNWMSSATWEWDGASGSWSLREPLLPVPGRVGHVAFFDADRSEVVVFGGFAYQPGGMATATFGDTWSFARASGKDAGTPRYPNGTPCTGAGSCASRSCVDGYCCASACSDACGACDVAGSEGKCIAVVGAPHGSRPACGGSGAGACAPRCDGKDVSACHARTTGDVCAAPSCTAGNVTGQASCDSSGGCNTATTKSCAPYGCNDGATDCATGCYGDAQCFSSGYFCYRSSDFAPGTCERYAHVTNFTASPSTPVVGSAVTLSASADETARFLFKITQDGAMPTLPCGEYSSNASCTWSPSAPGTYHATVSARNALSGRDDDTRELVITVGAP